MNATTSQTNVTTLARELADAAADLAGFLENASLSPELAGRVEGALERMRRELETLAGEVE